MKIDFKGYKGIMATKKKKLMVFDDGPEKGKVLEYRGPGGPPPQAHAAIGNGDTVIYRRRDIKPIGSEIRYVYKASSRQETKEATLHEGT